MTTSLAVSNLAPGAATAPQWRVAVIQPPGFISVKDAADLAIKSDLYQGSRTPATVRTWVWTLARAAIANTVAPVMVNGKLFLPRSLHGAFAGGVVTAPDVTEWASLPPHKRNRATAILQALQSCEAFLKSPEGLTLGRTEARVEFVRREAETFTYRDGSRGVRQLTLSAGSLARWDIRFRDGGFMALARDERGAYERSTIDQVAADHYWSIRLTTKRVSSASAWRLTVLEAKARNWKWFASKAVCRNWDKRTRPVRAFEFHRMGDREWMRAHRPFLEQDPESYGAGEGWLVDNTTLDAWVRTPGGDVVRPSLSAGMDWRSRKVLWLRATVTGNAESHVLGMAEAARIDGLPNDLISDNGKDFASYVLAGDEPKRRSHRMGAEFIERNEGLLSLAGIRVRWATPFNPDSKARIERFFSTLEDQFAQSIESYCGSTPDDRPAAHKVLAAKAIDWDEFDRRLAEWVAVYNDSPHEGDGMENLTPNQVMSQQASKRTLPDATLKLLMSAWHRPVSIHRNGLSIRIGGAKLSFGQFDQAIQALPLKTPVRVSYDPSDLRSVAVWTPEYKLICHAAANVKHDRSAMDSEALRKSMREIKAARNRLKAVKKDGLKAYADPVQNAIAAKAMEAAQSRRPNPPAPDGGTTLKPIQTPLEVPANVLPARKVVGGPDVGIDIGQDVRERFRQLHSGPTRQPLPKRNSLDLLHQMGSKGGGNA